MKHDASKHLVYLSGEMLPPDQAKISVFDTAVTLGDTVTESTRTFGHKPFKLEAAHPTASTSRSRSAASIRGCHRRR